MSDPAFNPYCQNQLRPPAASRAQPRPSGAEREL